MVMLETLNNDEFQKMKNLRGVKKTLYMGHKSASYTYVILNPFVLATRYVVKWMHNLL